jgi:hypothetical protein
MKGRGGKSSLERKKRVTATQFNQVCFKAIEQKKWPSFGLS